MHVLGFRQINQDQFKQNHLRNWFVLNLPKKELIDGVDWWSLFLLEQPQPQVSLLESFKDFASQ